MCWSDPAPQSSQWHLFDTYVWSMAHLCAAIANIMLTAGLQWKLLWAICLTSALLPVAYMQLVKSYLFPWAVGFLPMLSYGSLVSSALSKEFQKCLAVTNKNSIFLKGFVACGMFWSLRGKERKTAQKESHLKWKRCWRMRISIINIK